MKIANGGSERFVLFKIDKNNCNVAHGAKDKFAIFRANLFSIQLQLWNQFNTQYSSTNTNRIQLFIQQTMLHLIDDFQEFTKFFFILSAVKLMKFQPSSTNISIHFSGIKIAQTMRHNTQTKQATTTTTTNSFVII